MDILARRQHYDYLAINIQDSLNWGSHINTIINRANTTLELLRINLNIEKQKKETTYKAIVHPILGHSVWDPSTVLQMACTQ